MVVRIGIVGSGVIGEIHTECISHIKNAKLVAMCDSEKEKIITLKKKYKVDVYTNYEKMLQRDDIDLIDICTPSGMHAEQGIVAAKARKHVLVEKPIDIKLDRIDKLIEVCKEQSVKLGSIFQCRFDPAIIELKRAIEEGKFGDLLLGDVYVKWYREQSYYDKAKWRGTWEMDGGCLMNQTIHYIDLLQWIMGPVDSVYANMATLTHNMEAEDVATATLKFKSGALGVIEGSTATYPGIPERIEIHGEKGSVIVEGSKMRLWKFRDDEKEICTDTISVNTGANNAAAIEHESHRVQIEDMVKAILEDREPAITGEEARKAVEIVLAAYKSARKEQLVKFPLVSD